MTKLIDVEAWIDRLAKGIATEDAEEREFRAKAFRIASGHAHGEDYDDPDLVLAAKTKLPQYRTFAFDELDIVDEETEKAFGDLPANFKFSLEERTIPFVMSTESQDADGDRIIQRGWDLSRFRKSPRLLWSHNHSVPAIGSVLHPKVVNLAKGPSLVGLTKFALAEENEIADTVFKLAAPVNPEGKKRKPHINSGSVGFMPIKVTRPASDEEREELGLGRFGVLFEKQLLHEFSIVNVGSNPDAVELALKGAIEEGLIDADTVKMFTGSCLTEKDWTKRVTKSIVDLGGSKGWDSFKGKIDEINKALEDFEDPEPGDKGS